MNFLHKNTKKVNLKIFWKQTYVKYFLSYLIIFTVLILGFFFILRSQITEQYFSERTAQASIQLYGLAESLNEELIFLSQVDSSLKNSLNSISYNYKKKQFRYYTFNELTKFAACSKIIDSIVFLSEDSGDVISTQLHVKYVDGLFEIRPSTEKILVFFL